MHFYYRKIFHNMENFKKVIIKLIHNTIKISGNKKSLNFLGLISFIEAIFFPIPPDVFLIPIILISGISYYQVSKSSKNKLIQSDTETIIQKRLNRPIDDVNVGFGSGRGKDWKKIIQLNKNYFLGNGAMGDRYLINQSASIALQPLQNTEGRVALIAVEGKVTVRAVFRFESFLRLTSFLSSCQFVFSDFAN